MPKEDRFREFLVQLSGDYSGARVRWLRCLLHDHVAIGELSRRKINGIGLFNKLADQDEISLNNVNLLSEIAELTKEKSAISHVNEYKKLIKKYVPISERTKLTKYRKNLFRALREVEEDVLDELANSYQQDYSEFRNIWDLVFVLETSKRLENKQDKIKKFGNLLNKTAKDIFLNGLVTSKRKVASTKRKKGMQSSTTSSSSRLDDPDAMDGLVTTSKRKAASSKRRKGDQSTASSSSRAGDSDLSDDNSPGKNGGQIQSETGERIMQKWTVIVSICAGLLPILYGLFYVQILNSKQLLILFMVGFSILVVYTVLIIWPSSKLVLGKIILAVLAFVLPRLNIVPGTTAYSRIEDVVNYLFK